MNADKRLEIFRRLAEQRPNPVPELHYNSPFELLVAVILSAQATDISVNLATDKLFPVANTPESILDLGVEGLTPFIRHIGLYNGKAKNVIETCRLLLERHSGEVPDQLDALVALPGVGRKTANVVLNTAFRQVAMAVDTHIFRVSNRTGIAPGKDVVAVEKKLLRHVPKPYLMDAHHWLILHGRYTCVARTPKCPDCVIADLCDFRDKTPSVPARKTSASKRSTADHKAAAKKAATKKTTAKKAASCGKATRSERASEQVSRTRPARKNASRDDATGTRDTRRK